MIKVTDPKSFLTYVLLAVGLVIALNFISRDLFFRADLTANKIYSLSESSKAVIGKIDDRLTMKVYFTDNLPGQYGNTRRYLQDILEEYTAYSDGHIHFEFYEPETAEDLAEEARNYGIQPVQLQVIENDKLEVKRVYLGMVLLYEDKRQVLPVIQTTTGLEYDITTKIKQLVETRKRTVAFAEIGAGAKDINTISESLRESYDVRTVSLDTDVLPDVSVLIVAGVEDSLSQDRLDRLQAFLDRGGNLFLAQSRIAGNLQSQTGRPIRSNIFDFIHNLGFDLKENLVLDGTCSNITVSQQAGFLRLNSQMEYPYFPRIQTFGNHPAVNNLEQVRLLFSSEIAPADGDTTAFTPLLYTSDRSRTVTGGFYNLSPIQNPLFDNLNEPGKLVGAFTTLASDATANTSRILLVGDSQLFADSGGGNFSDNFIFIANAVDFLVGDSDLVALRSREITNRPLKTLTDAERTRWKWANILLPPVLIIGYGILRWKRENNRAKALEETYG